jgi:class 3 adenylate cyclase
MIKAVGALKVPTETKLRFRIGVATGVVVVGDQVSSNVGETPKLAARRCRAWPSRAQSSPRTARRS